MAFPFLPLEAVLAAAVLVGFLTVFGLALRVMDHALVGLRASMLPGIVAGYGGWAEVLSDHWSTVPNTDTAHAPTEEIEPAAPIPTKAVLGRLSRPR